MSYTPSAPVAPWTLCNDDGLVIRLHDLTMENVIVEVPASDDPCRICRYYTGEVVIRATLADFEGGAKPPKPPMPPKRG